MKEEKCGESEGTKSKRESGTSKKQGKREWFLVEYVEIDRIKRYNEGKERERGTENEEKKAIKTNVMYQLESIAFQMMHVEIVEQQKRNKISKRKRG